MILSSSSPSVTKGYTEDNAHFKLPLVQGSPSYNILKRSGMMRYKVVGSFLVHIVDPQPVDIPHDVTALLVEVPIEEVNIDIYSAIVFEAFSYDEGSSNYDHALRTEYALRNSASEDIYQLASAGAFCQPFGLHRCLIETRQRISTDPDDRYNILPGYYVVLQISPPSWHFQSCANFFLGAHAFAQEALNLIRDPMEPSVLVNTHSAPGDSGQYGQRSVMLHRRFFTEPGAVLHIVLDIWNDIISGETARLVYSPTPPQLEGESILNLIITETTNLVLTPILVSYFFPPQPPDLFPRCLGTFAVQIEPQTNLQHILRATPIEETLSHTEGSIWCEDRYHGIQEELSVENGTHVLVYGLPVEYHSSDEGAESEILTDDNEPIISSSARRGTSPAIWFLYDLLIGKVASLFAVGKQLLHGNVLAPFARIELQAKDFCDSPTPLRLRFPDEPIQGGQTIRICPIPNTPWEALEQRPPRVILFNFENLLYALRAAQIPVTQPAILDTYGLHDHTLGLRRLTTRDLQQRSIMSVVSNGWNDYAGQYDLAIRLVWPQPIALSPPQPIITLIVQVLDPFLHLVPNAVPVLIDQIATTGFDDERQARTIRVAEYISSPTIASNLFGLVRLRNSCQPRGLRYCHVNWRGVRLLHDSQMEARPGDYIAVVVGPLGSFFTGCETYFPRARRFALDGQRLMTQLLDITSIDVDIHAISTTNQPLGARVLTITMEDLINPQGLWTQAIDLWQDKLANNGSQLIHVDPQPSLTTQPAIDLLHLILVITPMPPLIPVLYGLTMVANGTDNNVAFSPRLTEPIADERTLLRASTFHRLASTLNGDYAIYSGYRRIGETGEIGVMPGTFLNVQITHRARSQILHCLLDFLDERGSSSSSSEPPTPQGDDENPGHSSRSTWSTSCFALLLIFLEPEGIGLYVLFATWFFLHPCRDLPPPGNGRVISLFKHLNDQGEGDEPDTISNNTTNRTVVDLRSGKLELLDDWQITDSVITVHDYIPCRVEASLPVAFSGNNALQLISSWQENVISPIDLTIPNLPAICAALIEAAIPVDYDNMESVSIYVDGSAMVDPDDESSRLAAFAMAVIGEQTNGFSLIGYTGGDVILDPTWKSWLGASFLNAIDAERSGVAVALLWALQWSYAGSFSIAICFDNQSAGYGASGLWRFDPTSLLGQLLRDLGQACEELYGNLLSFIHVKGHSNHPANDLADCLAKNVALGQLPARANKLDHTQLIQAQRTDGAYCWLGVAAALGKTDLPNVEAPFPCDRTVPRNLEESVYTYAPTMHTDATVHTQWLQFATINVRSLFADLDHQSSSMRFVEKPKYLAEQLAWSQYQIVGLQETCTRAQGITQIGQYLRYASGCNDQGLLGCELWIDNKIDEVSITAACLIPIHADPRRLVVRLQARGLDLVLAVLHAPHTGYTKDDIAEWWNASTRICSAAQRLSPLCLMVDANAQISIPHPPVVGDLLDGVDTFSTQCFIQFCSTCEVWLPSTFSHVHWGDTGTWTHHNGQRRRIDYVAIPSTWSTSDISSWVDTDIDLNQRTPDHYAAGCKVHHTWTKSNPARRMSVDFRQLADPLIRDSLERHLRDTAPIPWETDVHTHAFRIREDLEKAFTACLPAKRARPKTSYITDKTWQFRQAKINTIKHLKKLVTALQHCWKFWSYQAWATMTPIFAWYRPHLRWLLHRECEGAKLRNDVRFLVGQLRDSIRSDRLAFIDQCASDCGEQPLHLVFQELRKIGIGSRFLKFGPRHLPQFRKTNGQLAESTADIAEAWRKHCEALEAGHGVSREQLLHWVHGMNHHRINTHVCPSQIPSRTDLERHLRKMACQKAPGCDQIASDVCHHLPGAMSRLLYPLLLKEAILLEEPMEHKGGRLIYAFKGKGTTEDPANFRGLMITSVIGKSIRASFREKVLPAYRSYAGPGHFSARQFGHVGQAAMALRLFAKCAQDNGYSVAMAFLDIKSAYYKVCRELAVGFTGQDNQICFILQHFAMPEDALQELYRLLKTEGGAMTNANCDQYHCDLLTELSCGTWFVVDNSPILTQTLGGTRPGDGLADLLFGFIFAHLLRRLKSDLVDLHLWDERPWDDEGARRNPFTRVLSCASLPTTLDVLWADDLALAVRDSEAPSCVARIQAILDHLFGWCYKFGMEPNVARGKSEVLLQLRGSGSRKLKTRLFDCESPGIDVNPPVGPHMRLHIVASYKHLGGIHYVGGKLLKDIRVRCGMMAATFQKYAKKVFMHRQVPLLQKGKLLEALIFSILRWNLGSWHTLDKASAHRYNASTMRLARRVCIGVFGSDQVWSWTDEQVLARLQFPSPTESLHLARLAFFTTAFHTAPTGLWMLIAAERSWINEIERALQWAHDQLKCSTPYFDYHDFHEAWLQGVCANGRHWRGWLRRAKVHAILQRVNQATINEWHVNWYDRLQDAGFQLPIPRPYTNTHNEPPAFVCGPCRQVFRTKAAWATHSRKRHHRIDPMRRFIKDSRCRGCGSDYHTTRRLLAHLNYDGVCGRAHANLVGEVPPLPGRGATAEDKGPDLPIPVRRPRVPFQFFADDTGDEQVLLDHRFINALRSALTDLPDMMTGVVRIRHLVLTTVVATDDAWEALASLSSATDISDTAAEALHFVSLRWSLTWLLNDEDEEVRWPSGYFTCLNQDHLKADMFRQLEPPRMKRPTCLPSPPPCQKELFVIHFFSGVRREGDIQTWISSAQAPPGYVVTAISVDIIFDAVTGDLARRDIQSKWIDFVKRATVVGVYFGPPCNTWSISRWRALSIDDGPRPVRSVNNPLGLPSLRIKEIRDVILGNRLLFFALELTLIQAMLSRIAVLEHPAPHKKEHFPAIWHLPVVEALRILGTFVELDIYQGYYGAVSPKPTRLGIAGCRAPGPIFARFYTTSTLPPPLKMGKGKGEYNTAQLKEYPVAFSRALAQLSVEWWQRCCEGNPVESCTDDLIDFVRPFDVVCTDIHSRGADTRGRIDAWLAQIRNSKTFASRAI